MADIAIKFHSKSYASVDAATTASASNGAIVFDKTSKSIYVNSVRYGSNLMDASYDNNVLTITKQDNSTVELDFSSLATTKSVIAVFNEISGLLEKIQTATGISSDYTYSANTGTNYISGATSLNNADVKLDAAIKAVDDKVDKAVTDVKVNDTTVVSSNVANIAVDGTYNSSTNKIASQSTVTNAISGLTGSATIASESDGVVTLKTGVTETDGKISNTTGTTDINLAKVATTGKAVDVDIDDSESLITATNVEGALKEIAKEIDGMDYNTDKTANLAVLDSDTKIITLATTISEEDGKISVSGTQELAKVATTGRGEDVKCLRDSDKTDYNLYTILNYFDSEITDLKALPKFDTIVSTSADTTPKDVSWTSGTDTITGTLVASADTVHKIYLVSTGATGDNVYAEYVTVKNGDSYTWEKIGSTKAELDGYVKTITVNGKSYSVTSNTTDIALGAVVTDVAGETEISGGDTNYVKVSSTETTNSTNGTKVETLKTTVKIVSDIANATSDSNGLTTANDVKSFVENKINGLDSDKTSDDAAVATVEVKEEDGKITDVVVATVDAGLTYDETAKTLTATTTTGAITGGDDLTAIKSYIAAQKATVTNSDATLKVNDSNSTTLATIDGTNITAKAAFYWEEYE